MKKVKYLLFVILLLLSINVKADSNCDKKEKNRLTELAKKVEFDYNYELVDGKAVFSISAVNLNEDLQVVIFNGSAYDDDYREFRDNSNHLATINGFQPGEKVKITIRAFVPNFCSYEELLTKTIRLPYYNFYYSEEKCRGNEDFKYCKLLINSNITQEEFDRQYESYLQKKTEQEINPSTEKKDNMGLFITIGVFVLAVIVIVLIIMKIVKKRKKNML